MNQMTSASLDCDSKKKQSRRERFLAEMETVMPWAALLASYQLLQEAGHDDLWLDFQQVMDDFRRAVAEGDPDAACALFFDAHCSHVGPQRSLPETTRESIKMKTHPQLRVDGAQASNPTRLSRIRRLACPTLVIHAQESQEPERLACELIAVNAPLGRSIEVPKGGHMPPCYARPSCSRSAALPHPSARRLIHVSSISLEDVRYPWALQPLLRRRAKLRLSEAFSGPQESQRVATCQMLHLGPSTFAYR